MPVVADTTHVGSIVPVDAGQCSPRVHIAVQRFPVPPDVVYIAG